jgi:uncharacterized RDD family membrane protein YckC/cytoskeletal protein CcmA (bactofilin family)
MKQHGITRPGSLLAALVAAWMFLMTGFQLAWAADPAPDPGSPAEAAAIVPSEPEPAVVVAPSSPVPEPFPAPEAPRRQRLHEVVSVGSGATVKADQSASEVVVVYGDATIQGDVRGDVVVVFGKLTLEGRVRGDVVVVLGEADINGEIQGDTSVILSRSRFGPRADVDGDVVAVGVAPEIDPAASLKSNPEIVTLGPLMGYFDGAKEYLLQGVLFLRPFPPRVGWVWIAAGVFLVFHLLLALILSRPLGLCMETVREQPARSFLVGLIVCVLVGPVSLLLSFTVIAPLLIWMAFFALCIFGRVAAYGATGAALGRAAGVTGLAHPLAAVLAGSVVLYLSYMIPVVGLMVYALALPLGVGAVLIRVFDAINKERPPRPGLARPENFVAASGLVSGAPGPATHSFDGAGTNLGGTPVMAASGAPIPSGPSTEPVPPSATPPPTTPPSPPPFAGPVPPRVIPLAGVDDLAMPRVGFWPRFGASLIDLVLVGVVNAMTFQSAQSFWTLWAIYHATLWALKGTTVGGSVLNLRLVRLDGRAMDWQTAVVRVLGAVVSLVPLALGFFWASWDSEFQSWHDRIAGTTIVKPERKVTLV